MGTAEPDPPQPGQARFRALLRRYRLAAGLSQEELAERTGLSVAGLSALENGRRHAPYRHTVGLLANALGLSGAETATLEAAVDRVRAPASASPPAPAGHDRETTPAGGDKSSPVLASQTTRTNLPVQLTSFIGREREQGEVRALLQGATRLLTLTGAGGAGKTRLAQAVAGAVLSEYPDGVWLVELAPVADPVHVPKAAARTLEVAEQPGRPVRDSLVDALRPKHLLLVLDNCEHLVQACAELVEALLRACPDLRVLATSRQSLHVAGETTWRVPPMAVPPGARVPSDELLAHFDATRLFVERAMGGLPSFALSDQNRPAIVRICSRLDGIPLAIELAAARVAVLGLDQIDERLGDRFRLLTAGSRTALPHQQTLRATLDWSFGLLSKRERIVFRRLAVFAGGWILEAAEDICAGEGIGGEAVLDLLAGLVDKSLVVADAAGEARRYRLLETMREYGWEKLRATGEEAAVRDRHRDWLLALAEEADGQLRGAQQAAWLTRLESEHDNFRAALAWCTGEHRDVEAGLRLAGALAWFWRLHGHIGEGRRWLTLALAPPGGAASSARCRALNGAGLLAEPQGDDAAATALLEESLRLGRELGDSSAMAWALHGLGRVAEAMRDFSRANAVLEESLVHFRACDDLAGCAYSLLRLANVARERADYARAAALYAETLTAAREGGDTWLLGWTIALTANLAFLQGAAQRAAGLFREGLVLLHAIRATWGIAECLSGLAGVAGVQGQSEQAARLCGAEQALRARLGMSTNSDYQHGLTAARAALGNLRFDALAAEGQAMSLDEVVAYALTVDNGAARPSDGAERRSASLTSTLLTPREHEVAALIARGYTNRQIAATLVITPRTADTHVRNISTKLELHSRAQVAAWATEHGLPAATTPR
jgi:non-specific serine/threonine protein kinase